MIEQSVSSARGSGAAGMTTRASTLEMLRAPGLAVERSLELSGQWFNELCMWLQSPIGALGPLGMADGAHPRDHRLPLPAGRHRAAGLPAGGVVRAGAPAGVHRLRAGRVGIEPRAGRSRPALSTRARLGDEDLARSLLVARMAGDLESYGDRDATGPAGDRRDVARPAGGRWWSTRPPIRHFATLAGTHYPIHEDEHYAWAQGFPTILVQGLLLFMTQLYYAGVGPSGQGEMWFRRAVPAGSLLESCQSTTDPEPVGHAAGRRGRGGGHRPHQVAARFTTGESW